MEPEAKEISVYKRRAWPLVLVVCLVLLAAGLFFFFRHRGARDIVSGLVADPAENLTSLNGRTNIVFLGLGGEGHEAPDLTDSIIFVSLKHEDNSVTLSSIPRDIWVDTMAAKVNTAYHYGNERREGGGRDLAKSAVSEIMGAPVHYVIALDFQGFIRAIDSVGGIDVNVDRSFDDYLYPIPGKELAEPESSRYEHLRFDQGMTHMDGATALRFARSRHAEGEEGTDFARSARQQKILLAFKDKLLESKTFLNRETLTNVFNSFADSVDTDIKESDYGSFLRFFLAFEKSGESSKSISLEKDLVNPKNKAPYGGQWVLVPAVSWEALHKYVGENLQ